ncbi:predicted protein [Naegleria gruberi]|uniref:Predicted protein n=1 Tax=Naegleria gruberi TaxID=5762 RepID=D2VCX9_NAEGR|nr:uncharacterized protein NAEGRDRAFT_66727 [Naegleria gruberi]EFC45502.1 predicted protein [Naegleria gruberi]|eukprot:XP_002678246.1 predicted protein [Naegleria gruberi strain NEG-M]
MLSLIFVSDSGSNRIMVFDLKTKKFIQSFTGITSPLMISIDSSDQKYIYFSNMNNQVGKYDIEQKKIIWETSQNLRHPSGIVADNSIDGRLYVSDCSNNEIKCLSKQDGKLISSFGACKFPFGLEINTDGDLIVTSLATHTISVISKVLEKKQIYFSFGKKGVGLHEFQYPRGVFVEKLSGYIYICDQSNSRIHVFDNFGSFIQSFGEIGSTGKSHFKFPTGLCISESRGELFVADTHNKRIQVFR